MSETIYRKVMCSERLPETTWRGFVHTINSQSVTRRKLATLWPDKWVIDGGFKDEVVIEWLEEVQLPSEQDLYYIMSNNGYHALGECEDFKAGFNKAIEIIK